MRYLQSCKDEHNSPSTLWFMRNTHVVCFPTSINQLTKVLIATSFFERKPQQSNNQHYQEVGGFGGGGGWFRVEKLELASSNWMGGIQSTKRIPQHTHVWLVTSLSSLDECVCVFWQYILQRLTPPRVSKKHFRGQSLQTHRGSLASTRSYPIQNKIERGPA